MGKLDLGKRAYAVALLCATTAIGLRAQTLATLTSFDGTHGAFPLAPLVQATNGRLYGTTSQGGGYGDGTLFKIAPIVGSPLATLHTFDGTDGRQPFLGAMVQAANGNFYGTTWIGGANDQGTVYEVTPGGTLITLYNFCSQSGCPDGDEPYAGLVQASDGNFYGTTSSGGVNNRGTVFKITPSGALTTLYSFGSISGDGSGPYGTLVQASNGNLYGTTANGGAHGGGTVFKLSLTGALTTLYSFCSLTACADGQGPFAGLVQGTDGNFYGTTFLGGTSGEGAVFKITSSGRLITLHSFDGADGEWPSGPVTLGSDENFYGTTQAGGANGEGTLFEITPSGTLTSLYSFCSESGCVDGQDPWAGLIQVTDGNFYGTAQHGGTSGQGTVFSLSVGLGPFVETEPTFGKVGRAVKILGTNLTGASSVTFNSTPAAFTVVLGSLISATVPAGATTGTVQVVTPSGTLNSNVPFRVGP